MDQLLYLLGRDFLARPRLLPPWLWLCDGLGMVAVFPTLGGRPRAVFGLEDILEEGHPLRAWGSSGRARQRALTGGRYEETGVTAICGVVSISWLTGVTADAGSKLELEPQLAAVMLRESGASELVRQRQRDSSAQSENGDSC